MGLFYGLSDDVHKFISVLLWHLKLRKCSLVQRKSSAWWYDQDSREGKAAPRKSVQRHTWNGWWIRYPESSKTILLEWNGHQLTTRSFTSFLLRMSSTNGMGLPLAIGIVANTAVLGASRRLDTFCLNRVLNISIFPISSTTYTGISLLYSCADFNKSVRDECYTSQSVDIYSLLPILKIFSM